MTDENSTSRTLVVLSEDMRVALIKYIIIKFTKVGQPLMAPFLGIFCNHISMYDITGSSPLQ